MASPIQKTNLKKTLLITIDFPPQVGGVASYLADFSNNLDNNNIIVLANKQEGSEKFDKSQNYKIIRENLYYKNFWPKWLKIYFIAKKIIKQEKIEQIIISHVLPIGYITLLLNLPYFIIFHGYDVLAAQKTWWKKNWFKIITKKAKHLIVNSNFTKNQLTSKGIDKNKITIVSPCPNITPKQLSEAESQIIKNELELEGKKILLTVGRFVKRKGVDKVIECLPELTKKIPNLVYIIVGSGPYKNELEKLAEKLKVRGNLIVIENPDSSHIANFYDLADIFIMTSRIENKEDVEGFGIVYLEANSFGKPVIAGKSGGVEDAVIHNQTGLLVDPINCSNISQSILKLFNDQNLMNKFGEQGKNRVNQEFQWFKQVNKLKNIL